jgi:hypothetical protein
MCYNSTNNWFKNSFGGNQVEEPQPSAQEQELLDALLEDYKDQREESDALLPSQMHDAHMGWKWNTEDGLPPDSDEPIYTEEQQSIIDKRDELIKEIQNGKHDAGTLNGLNEIKAGLDKQIASWDTKKKKAEVGDTDYGSWVQLTDDEWYNSEDTTDSERRAFDLDKAQSERSLKAIKGELPLSESLLDQKQKEFDQLKQVYGITGDSLENASGNDTVAIQNLDAFKKRWAQMEDAQRFGNSSSSVESAIMSSGLTNDLTKNQTGMTMGLNNQGNNSFSQGMSLLSPFQNYNLAGYQARSQNQAVNAQMTSGLLGLIAAGLIGSSRKFKKNIKKKTKKDEDKALKELTSLKSYSYKYKTKMGMGNKTHTGVIAEEAPESIKRMGGKVISLADKWELTNMAVKALSRKVDKVALHKSR